MDNWGGNAGVLDDDLAVLLCPPRWRPPQLGFLLLHPWSYALRIIGMRVSRILAADGAQVVIPVTAHLCLFGRGKCMTPKVRSLDGVARALLCVEHKPCRLHVVLLR
jgi:hypothetical protein